MNRLVIGDDCFKNVNEFVIDGLNELESVKIGERIALILIRIQIEKQVFDNELWSVERIRDRAWFILVVWSVGIEESPFSSFNLVVPCLHGVIQ